MPNGSGQVVAFWQSSAMVPPRIREHRKRVGLTIEQLASDVGLSVSQISRAERGERDLRVEELKKIAARLRITVSDLTNEVADGDFVRGPVEDDQHATVVDDVPRVGAGRRVHLTPGTIPEFDLRAGASYGGGYVLQGQVNDGEQTYDADVVKAEWGIPPSFLQGEVRLQPRKTDVLAVDGPSMVPDLLPGDRVFIDRSHTDPRQGGIFAVREDGGVIIKHVEVVRGSDPPRIVCKSSNPTYAPFELILDGDNVAIIGRVAGRISRM